MHFFNVIIFGHGVTHSVYHIYVAGFAVDVQIEIDTVSSSGSVGIPKDVFPKSLLPGCIIALCFFRSF